MKDKPWELLMITIGLLTCIVIMAFGNSIRTADIAALESRLDAAELGLAAKIPEPIKFYTIPGYACDTTEWPGLCSNLGMDQKEYELKNSHLFKDES